MMIATLEGRVSELVDNIVILDVSGLGYGIWVSHEDWGRLTLDSKAKLYIYEHIREQSHDLYGFTHIETKRLFERLLSVNGVGPKMALAILNIGSISDVRQAIAEGNVKFLLSAPGVGKKVAERIIVDIKDKVGLIADPGATTFLSDPSIGKLDDAEEALVALGFSAQDASRALSGVDSTLTVEERVTLALRGKK